MSFFPGLECYELNEEVMTSLVLYFMSVVQCEEGDGRDFKRRKLELERHLSNLAKMYFFR